MSSSNKKLRKQIDKEKYLIKLVTDTIIISYLYIAVLKQNEWLACCKDTGMQLQRGFNVFLSLTKKKDSNKSYKETNKI